MNSKLVSPGIILALVVVGFLWLKFFHDPAVRERAHALFQADSIEAVEAAQVEADARFDSATAVLTDSLRQLESVAFKLQVNLKVARQVSTVSTETLDSVMARDTTVSDTVREAVTEAVEALETEVATCQLLVMNCQDQVGLLKTQVERGTMMLDEARRQRTELAERVMELLRKGRGGGITIGASIGYGATLSGGQVYAGPSLSVGVNFKFFTLGG